MNAAIIDRGRAPGAWSCDAECPDAVGRVRGQLPGAGAGVDLCHALPSEFRGGGSGPVLRSPPPLAPSPSLMRGSLAIPLPPVIGGTLLIFACCLAAIRR